MELEVWNKEKGLRRKEFGNLNSNVKFENIKTSSFSH
tara:strand:+ start:919 stop:1029 length:111 start_codon:yes stop_codon:yes gene_type:complete